MKPKVFWAIARKVIRLEAKKSSAAIQKIMSNAGSIFLPLDFLVTFLAMKKVTEVQLIKDAINQEKRLVLLIPKNI